MASKLQETGSEQGAPPALVLGSGKASSGSTFYI